MRKKFKSSVAAVLAAALVLSSISFESAQARSRHYHHSRANAAVAGAVIGLFGAIAAAAAADSYRHRYYGYYDGGPYYGYAPPVYPHRHWHHDHRSPLVIPPQGN